MRHVLFHMQDWTPVVLRSASAFTNAKKTTRSVASLTAAAVEKNTPQKTLSPESRTTLTAKRVALKLTQVQLNQRCSFAPNSIRDFENGSLCPSNGQLNLLNRILGGGLRLG